MKAKLLLTAAAAALTMGSMSLSARAEDPVLVEVLKRLDKLERENAKLRAKVEKQASAPKAEKHASRADDAPRQTVDLRPAPGTLLQSDDGWFFHKKDGAPLTFQTPGGEIGIYGQFDVSFDATSKGIENKIGNGGDRPVGNAGWLPAISSNLSLIGIRGYQKIPDTDLRFLYQLETLIDVAVNAGTAESNSNKSNVVRGALTTRDSFIGVESKDYGALKIGKTEAPYKKSTDIFNPFSGMLGDYRVIMGNTGGDNRVEFATRLEHSLWWESPDWNGVKLAALYSPGQNRANNSDNISAGASDCAGGNNPSSGGFATCSDGAFSDAISLSGTYKKDGLLITTAYERHEKVNRSSDIFGIYGNNGVSGVLGPSNLTPNALALYNADTAAEDAFKVGALYKFEATKTTVGGIYETLHRYVPSTLKFQNERERDGTWFFVTQELSPKDEVSFGWAHAFKTPGDPGQHTFVTLTTTDGENGAFAPNLNDADMLTAVYKHKFSPALTWYLNGAMTMNDTTAHYDLGAGGHGVTTDGHDASGGTNTAGANGTTGGGLGANPHTFTGGNLVGVSTGLNYKF